MKNLRKYFKVVASLVVLCIVLNTTAVVGAATITTYKDGSYDMETTSDSSGSHFVLHIKVTDNKIKDAEFNWYVDSRKMTSAVLLFVPAEQKDGVKATIEEAADYEKQLKDAEDGSKVVALTENSGIYTDFQDCWSQFLEKSTVTMKEASVAKSSVTLYLTGTNKKLTNQITLKDADGYKVSYKSEKSSIATVSKKGVITAKKSGSTNIVVTFEVGNQSYTKNIKVVVKAK